MSGTIPLGWEPVSDRFADGWRRVQGRGEPRVRFDGDRKVWVGTVGGVEVATGPGRDLVDVMAAVDRHIAEGA